MTQYQNILVPIDFSETSEAALDHARGLADKFGSTLHLLHVVQEPFTEFGSAETYGISVPDVLENIERDVRDDLTKLVTAEERQASRVRILTRVGSPRSEIVACAKDAGMDLIVMGTHGRGGMSHVLIGSVAERVVRLAPCPVLTVRHP